MPSIAEIQKKKYGIPLNKNYVKAFRELTKRGKKDEK